MFEIEALLSGVLSEGSGVSHTLDEAFVRSSYLFLLRDLALLVVGWFLGNGEGGAVTVTGDGGW